MSTTQMLDGHAKSPAKARARSAEEWVEGFARGWHAPAFEEEFVRPLFALIPDVHGEVERWAARDDTLYIEMTLHGTLGGRPLSWRVCDRVTLRDGVAVERESYFDSLPLLAAVVRTPRSWPRYLRVQARRVIPKIAKWRKK